VLALTDLLVYWCSGSCPRIALQIALRAKIICASFEVEDILGYGIIKD